MPAATTQSQPAAESTEERNSIGVAPPCLAQYLWPIVPAVRVSHRDGAANDTPGGPART